MKVMILVLVSLLVISYSVLAQLPSHGYIGLYTDETHTNSCVTGIGLYFTEMWICCLPSEWGHMCAEYAISYPPNVIQSTVTYNIDIVCVTLGDLESGMSICYCDCQWDWHWDIHQTLVITDSTPAWIEIVEHPETGDIRFANCQDAY
ncbi:MAG: hypothetical protein JSV33_09255 [bacterium]|nr:MAG: hypothetical protein JSV33_09255 [bacterium]